MKKQGQEIQAFGELLSKKMGKEVKVQTHWTTATEIDWEAKTMTVKGVTDGLEFYDVLLGLGSIYKKPKLGTSCLIGVIQNQAAATFLIDAAEIDELLIEDKTGFKCHLKDGKLTLNGDAFSGIVKAPELKKQIDKNTLILQNIQQVFANWVVSPQDGGAALKASAGAFTGLPRAALNNIENTAIKHG